MNYQHYEPCLTTNAKLPSRVSKKEAATYLEVYTTFMELKEHDEACTERIWSHIQTVFLIVSMTLKTLLSLVMLLIICRNMKASTVN